MLSDILFWFHPVLVMYVSIIYSELLHWKRSLSYFEDEGLDTTDWCDGGVPVLSCTLEMTSVKWIAGVGTFGSRLLVTEFLDYLLLIFFCQKCNNLLVPSSPTSLSATHIVTAYQIDFNFRIVWQIATTLGATRIVEKTFSVNSYFWKEIKREIGDT